MASTGGGDDIFSASAEWMDQLLPTPSLGGSTPQRCVAMMTWVQLLCGAVGSTWTACFLETAARSRFMRAARADAEFSDREQVYFWLHSAPYAWMSFIAALPALACVAWYAAVAMLSPTL